MENGDGNGEFVSLETYLANMPETHRQQNLLLNAESMLNFLVDKAQNQHGIRLDTDRSEDARRDVTTAIAAELREMMAQQPAFQSKLEGALALCVYHLCLSAADSANGVDGIGSRSGRPQLRIVSDEASE
ncbi:hypothetical protein BKG82_26595 [Mycobacteroides chelonae]|uniref:Uncharacterized protein n=1 Tax=Mycobacteroides chelonae TaxID=1774 RepID=A0A1S1LHP7_MYCCH|nr:hypothetical protein [Mycobacteroides chelonae]OHU47227.1 hypothetical protein BKG82_26595 [Mycobacteroides chelonae]